MNRHTQPADLRTSRLTDPRDLFGHPRGLFVLFMTETWAQFSYFGMQAMLVYYMIKQLHFDQPAASGFYGLYCAYAYLTPLLGGVLADRWLGQGRAVVAGSLIMAAGHFALAFQAGFFPGLLLVGLGNGLFLPSTATQVGQLYADGDPRRDRAYSIYYMGINIGGFLAPLVCGTVGELFGWHFGFAIAGIGMLIGLATYLTNRGSLPRESLPTRGGRLSLATLDDAAKRSILTLLAIAAVVVLFRIAYEQSGNTIAVWADARTDRVLRVGATHMLIPATWFQSVNPLLIFVLTPIITAWWARQARRGSQPSPFHKMALGSLLVGLAFILMLGAAHQAHVAGRSSWLWLIGFFVLLTAGELYVVPVGLSVFNQLAPTQLASALIGVWYLGKFGGSLAAGLLGAQWQRVTPSVFFLIGAGSAFAAALAFMLLGALLRRAAAPTHSPGRVDTRTST